MRTLGSQEARDKKGGSAVLSMDSWNHAWLVLLIIFAGGLAVGKLSEKPRIPDVAAYLVYGIILGPAVLHLVNVPNQSNVNQFILNLGATLILFEGGRGLELSMLKRVWLSISLLATLGVFITAAVVGITAHLVLGTSWILSLLMGSVIASTDPATLIPVFKRVFVRPKLKQTAESESAFSDATGTVLVATLLAAHTGESIQFGAAVLAFVKSAGIGIIIGFSVGILSLALISRQAWGRLHEFSSFLLLISAIGAYAGAEALGASGFMAAFVAGLVSGNGPTFGWGLEPHTEQNVAHFNNAMTLMMRMMIFVLLGTQVDFTLVSRYLLPGLVVVGTFMVVGRPLTVLASLLPDRKARWQGREIAFMFWVRETGVIPAALAGMVAAEGVHGANIVGSITFMAILLTIVIQAGSTEAVAKWLGVLAPVEPAEDI